MWPYDEGGSIVELGLGHQVLDAEVTDVGCRIPAANVVGAEDAIATHSRRMVLVGSTRKRARRDTSSRRSLESEVELRLS